MSRPLLFGVLALAAVGLALSIELTLLHYRIHTDPTYESWCKIGETVNCDAVERSPYAVAFGLPVSLWGGLGYLVMIGVVLSGLLRRPAATWPRGALLGISALFVLVSAENAAISWFVVQAVCVLCTGTYVVNLGLLVTTLVATRRSGGGTLALVWSDVVALRRQWLASAIAAICFVGAGAALITHYPRYWHDRVELPGGPAGLPNGRTESGTPWIGAREPRVTIVEFSDYQCPFCSRSHSVVRRAVAQQPDRIRLEHRHFPLDIECNDLLDRPFHPYACAAARAAECAADQGKFWEMNDLLYLAQHDLRPDKIDRFVDKLALDRTRFAGCLSAAETEHALQQDIDAADRLKTRGTPLYLINGRLHRGGLTLEQLASVLAEAERTPASSAASQPVH